MSGYAEILIAPKIFVYYCVLFIVLVEIINVIKVTKSFAHVVCAKLGQKWILTNNILRRNIDPVNTTNDIYLRARVLSQKYCKKNNRQLNKQNVAKESQDIVNIVSRMSRMCVLRLTPDELCLNVSTDGSPVVWAELAHRHFFNEYVVVGVSDVQNEIYLDFDAVMLSQSLNSLKQTALTTKIKLTNKQRPCLTVEVELPSLANESWQCVHDVPVRVIPRREWPIYKAPNIPVFDISIDLPPLRHVRNIVERMKNMSPFLTVSADGTGTLTLKISTDCANVATHFQGLNFSKGSRNDSDEPIAARVDVRRFLTFLAWEVINPATVKCSILNERIIYLYFNLDENVDIHYFIPAVAM